jgi:protein gp37
MNGEVATRQIQVHMFAGGEMVCRQNKKEAGRLLDGRTWDEVPVVDYGRSIGAFRVTAA